MTTQRGATTAVCFNLRTRDDGTLADIGSRVERALAIEFQPYHGRFFDWQPALATTVLGVWVTLNDPGSVAADAPRRFFLGGGRPLDDRVRVKACHDVDAVILSQLDRVENGRWYHPSMREDGIDGGLVDGRVQDQAPDDPPSRIMHVLFLDESAERDASLASVPEGPVPTPSAIRFRLLLRDDGDLHALGHRLDELLATRLTRDTTGDEQRLACTVLGVHVTLSKLDSARTDAPIRYCLEGREPADVTGVRGVHRIDGYLHRFLSRSGFPGWYHPTDRERAIDEGTETGRVEDTEQQIPIDTIEIVDA